MNGRMYDAKLGRFLSPDNFVQDPYNTQNFNRYGYVLNNPLMYSDPSGEFIHLIIGAVIGGVINWAINGAEFTWKGLGHFAVGAVAGALSAGIGAGVSSAIAGGSFSAGFMGTQAAMTAASSFVTGAAVGASAGFSAGFTTGLGNGLLNGQNFGQALWSGFRDGFIGGVSGGVIGGLSSGIHAAIDRRDFWHGGRVTEQHYVNNFQAVKQENKFDCVIATHESYDKTFGYNNSDSYYNNLRTQNPDGVQDIDSYFNSKGYISNDIRGYASIKNSLEYGNPVILEAKTGVTNIVNGTSYNYRHALTVTGYKTFDNGRTLWQIFNPATGSLSSTYSFPSATAGHSIMPITRLFRFLFD